jgi:hypothetical protein
MDVNFVEKLRTAGTSTVTNIDSAPLLKVIKQEAARGHLSTTIKTGNPLLEASQGESNLPDYLLRV